MSSSKNILIYGDSMINGLDDQKIDTEVNFGFTIEQMLNKEKEGIGLSYLLNEHKYNSVIICAGHNDITNGFSSEVIT
jgi:hypothetical protein